jgi:prepilin-type N-terminal cleavage/methylation domain-containing protein
MTSRCHLIPRRRGVTLMEVLATLLLVGIVLPAVMQGVTVSMQAASRARHQTEAAALAEAKLNELLASSESSVITGSGDFGADWPDYRWDTAATSRDLGLYEITVTIRWTERGAEQTYQLTSLFFPETAGAL